MQFGFMPDRGRICALFISITLQGAYHAKGEKLYFLCLVDMEKAFDSVLKKVMEWPMKKIGMPEILAMQVMSLYEGAVTRVRVDSGFLEEFEVKLGIYQGSVLSPFFFPVVIDVVSEVARDGALSELLFADDLVLMSQTIEGLENKFLKWMKAF